MSVIEFKNARGQVRYQPAHPDGRRLYEGEWLLPPGHPSESRVRRAAEDWRWPTLYRSKRRASRKLSQLIASEFNEEQNHFKAVAK